MRSRGPALVGALSLFALSSCKENNITQNNTTNNTFVSQLIGPSGGTINGPGGSVLTFPPGALTSDKEIKISELTDQGGAVAPGLPPDFQPMSSVFSLEPHGQLFALDVVLALPHHAGNDMVQLWRAPMGGSWANIPVTQVDGSRVIAQTKTFSFWVIGRSSSNKPPMSGDGGADASITAMSDGGPGPQCITALNSVRQFTRKQLPNQFQSCNPGDATPCTMFEPIAADSQVLGACAPIASAQTGTVADRWRVASTAYDVLTPAEKASCGIVDQLCGAGECTPCSDTPVQCVPDGLGGGHCEFSGGGADCADPATMQALNALMSFLRARGSAIACTSGPDCTGSSVFQGFLSDGTTPLTACSTLREGVSPTTLMTPWLDFRDRFEALPRAQQLGCFTADPECNGGACTPCPAPGMRQATSCVSGPMTCAPQPPPT